MYDILINLSSSVWQIFHQFSQLNIYFLYLYWCLVYYFNVAIIFWNFRLFLNNKFHQGRFWNSYGSIETSLTIDVISKQYIIHQLFIQISLDSLVFVCKRYFLVKKVSINKQIKYFNRLERLYVVSFEESRYKELYKITKKQHIEILKNGRSK